jgi:putative membrane protein
MTRIFLLPAALAFLFSGLNVRAIDDTKPAEKPFDDTEFVQMAASGGMHEVALGKIAANRSKNAAVKAFGERMVADHGKANEELKKAAAALNIPVTEKMSEQHQKEVERFANYTGSDFDRDYVKHMIADHESDVALFTRASKLAVNAAIKEFAMKTLPVVEEHLKALKKLQPME